LPIDRDAVEDVVGRHAVDVGPVSVEAEADALPRGDGGVPGGVLDYVVIADVAGTLEGTVRVSKFSSSGRKVVARFRARIERVRDLFGRMTEKRLENACRIVISLSRRPLLREIVLMTVCRDMRFCGSGRTTGRTLKAWIGSGRR
jgi:hypothetical protein